jgi:hypothetical protein
MSDQEFLIQIVESDTIIVEIDNGIEGSVTSGGVSDGDKGDVIVTGSGTVWTLDNSAVAGKTAATVASGDLVLIGDISDSNNLKKVTAQEIANLAPSGVTDHTALSNIGTNTHAQIDSHLASTANPHSTTKSQIGLSNVDNTSDASKPVSTATQTALDLKVDENAAITGATKTKITYDSKGLVTVGADATTADIADSLNRRYVTDAQLVVIGNTSGANTGDNAVNSLYSGLVSNATHTGDATGATALTLANAAITGKTTVTAEAADFVLISDTSDSGNLKKALVSDFGGGGTPGGSDTQVQFNDGGAFGGDAGLTYAKSTDTLTSVNQTITGVIDAGGATSLEIPNSAAPTVNADGEIAVDTTVADFSHGIVKYYSGEEMAVIAVPIAELTTPTDGHIVAYNATNDEFELVAPSGVGGSVTKTLDIFMVGTVPDSTGDAFFEPYSILATNDLFRHLILRCGASNSAAPTVKAGVYGRFRVPEDYNTGGTVTCKVYWTSTLTSGNVVFDLDYRAIGGNDTESLDQGTYQESLTVTDAAPSAANERMEASMTITASNLAAGDTVEFFFGRDGADGADTLAGSAIVHEVIFSYTT